MHFKGAGYMQFDSVFKSLAAFYNALKYVAPILPSLERLGTYEGMKKLTGGDSHPCPQHTQFVIFSFGLFSEDLASLLDSLLVERYEFVVAFGE